MPRRSSVERKPLSAYKRNWGYCNYCSPHAAEDRGFEQAADYTAALAEQVERAAAELPAVEERVVQAAADSPAVEELEVQAVVVYTEVEERAVRELGERFGAERTASAHFVCFDTLCSERAG